MHLKVSMCIFIDSIYTAYVYNIYYMGILLYCDGIYAYVCMNMCVCTYIIYMIYHIYHICSAYWDRVEEAGVIVLIHIY